jgi:DNA helicase-2/ATP-dependent DNA helicase PcrA
MYFLIKRLLDRRFTLESQEVMLERNTLLEATEQEEILRSKEFMAFIKQQANLGEITPKTFSNLTRNGKMVLSKEKIYEVYTKTPVSSTIGQRMQAVAHYLEELYDKMIFRKARQGEYHDRILQLTEEQQEKFFGKLIEDTSKRNITRLAEQFLRAQYKKVYQQIRRYRWLDFQGFLTRAYEEFTNGEQLNVDNNQVLMDVALLLVYVQHLYSKSIESREVKYVLVDEVQDYSPAQMELIQTIYPRAKFTLLGDENQAIFQTSNTFENIAQSFIEKEYQVTRRDLLTSYRSNGPITQLFERLANKSEEMTIVLVREDGVLPQFAKAETKKEYLLELMRLLENAPKNEAVALITKNTKEAQSLHNKLQEIFNTHLFTQDTREVPGKGINILPISLAKGLEFDHVIVHDVSKEHFSTDRDRHLLYTMISRAMKSVSLPFISEVTNFLK